MTFIDDRYRKLCVYFLKQIRSIWDFQDLESMVENETWLNIKQKRLELKMVVIWRQ